MNRKPIVALIYDFDGTLSPGNMQEFGFIQAIHQTPEEFWTKSDGIAKGQDASNILSYMKLMHDEAKKNGIKLTRADFRRYGADIIRRFPFWKTVTYIIICSALIFATGLIGPIKNKIRNQKSEIRNQK